VTVRWVRLTKQQIAVQLRELADRFGILVVFKGSFDKANRTSALSYRGPGLYEGLRILSKVRAETGLPVLTDIHESAQASEVALVVDVLQTPACLARQTDLIEAAAGSGKPVHLKKAQFMAPVDMAFVLDKARRAAAAAGHDPDRFLLCERGTNFGYHDLVVDFRGLQQMADLGAPVVFDATHSFQRSGKGAGGVSSDQPHCIPALVRAATAVGISGLFLETHPNPVNALSDGPNSWPLDQLSRLVEQALAIDGLVKNRSL
jgi:2-dehydro-3-deoxyphosphooctonate aldolase (KDO 8-P synthase)